MEQTLYYTVCGEACGQHHHDHPQIMIPVKENMQFCIGTIKCEVAVGELCLIPPGQMHECSGENHLLVLNIPAMVSERMKKELFTYPLIVPYDGVFEHLVECIREELEENPRSRAVDHLYCYLYEKILEKCSSPSMRYIVEHYDEHITVVKLAKLESYNVTYFSDWFKRQTGFLPSLYLRYARITKTMELLERTELSMPEIAAKVGYSSNATLTRAFHSMTGMSPKAYRDRSHLRKIS